jgi:hypothetical protein
MIISSINFAKEFVQELQTVQDDINEEIEILKNKLSDL